MTLTTPSSIQKLQTALHAKAKEEPEYRFYLLYDKVYRGDVLQHAYACCKANKGAAGVDDERFEDIEAYGVERWLGELAEDLRKKTYQSQAVRRVYLKKPNGKLRPIGIPPIRDRVVQTAAVWVLTPIFEADMPAEQHAYRPERNALTAVREVHRLLNTGHTRVVEADLSGYFDSLPHAELMTSVARRVVDRQMLHLIKMWLEAPVEETDERGRKRRTTQNRDTQRGVPQGSPISPLLANLYMRRFILGWKRLGFEARYQARIVSYADDFVICCKGSAEEAMAAMRRTMERLKLMVNEEKTRTCEIPEEHFDFLGVHVWTMPLDRDGTCVYRYPSLEEECAAVDGRDQRGDDPPHDMDGGRGDGGATQPKACGLGPVLLFGAGRQSVSGGPSPHHAAATPVARHQAQGSPRRIQMLSCLLPPPDFGVGRTAEAETELSVGDDVMSCPRAGCGKSACPVR